MKNVLVIGSTVIDVIIQIDHLPSAQEDVHVQHQHMSLGGCAYNVSDMIRHFGVPYTLFSPVGTGAYGDFVRTQIFSCPNGERIVSEQTSATLRHALEQVVDGGSGKNAYIKGYRIGGKTATSETLPRSANKYISSFIGFAPADDPQVIALCVINNPQGLYYGGLIAAPVVKGIFENILPYLGIEKTIIGTETEK